MIDSWAKRLCQLPNCFVTDKDLHDRSILHVNYYSMFAQESITPLKLRFDQLIKYNNTHVHDPTLSNTLQGTKVKCTVLYTTWVATKIIAIFLCNLVLHVHVCETVDCNYGTNYYGDEVHVSNVYLQTYMIWYVLTTLQSLKCFRLTHCGRERREHTNSTTTLCYCHDKHNQYVCTKWLQYVEVNFTISSITAVYYIAYLL